MRITISVKGVGRRVAQRARELLRACLRQRHLHVDGVSLSLAPASSAGRFRAVLILDQPSNQRRITAVHGSANGALAQAVARGFTHHADQAGGGR